MWGWVHTHCKHDYNYIKSLREKKKPDFEEISTHSRILKCSEGKQRWLLKLLFVYVLFFISTCAVPEQIYTEETKQQQN